MKNPMTPVEIKKALAVAGYSQTDVATELELSKSHVNRVIKGLATSHRVRSCVAEKIGRKVEEVFFINNNPSKPGPKTLSRFK